MNRHEAICKNLTDQEIILRSIHEREYFACLYRRYELKMLRYISKLSGASREEAEDILQDAFIKIWRNLNLYRPDMSFSSWVYRIVHNETISHWRRNKRNPLSTSEPSRTPENQADEGATDNKEPDLDTEPRIQQILSQLKKEYREILILKFLEDQSYEEISDILRIPEGTVATRINRAKKAFRKLADKDLNFLP